MKKLLSFLLVVSVLVLCSSAFADISRTTVLSTSGALTADAVVAGHGIDIYRIMFNATAATAQVGIYDAAGLGGTLITACMLEIYEATDGEGHYIDFGDNPLKLNTGCALIIEDAAVVLHYR